jgi:hypothetical protein
LSPAAAELGVLARWASDIDDISDSASKQEIQERVIAAIKENFIEMKHAEQRREERQKSTEDGSESQTPSRPASASPSENEEVAQLEKDAKILGVDLGTIEIPPHTESRESKAHEMPVGSDDVELAVEEEEQPPESG